MPEEILRKAKKKIEEDEAIKNGFVSNVSVDNVIFTMHEGKLKVLLVKYNEGLAAGKWGIIGHWIKEDEEFEIAASRVVKQATGVQNIYLEQLGAFGGVNRYPIRRVITVAYFSLVRYEETHAEFPLGKNAIEGKWFDVKEVPELIFDHAEILNSALLFLKYKVRHEPVGFSLLPEKFTLLQLQEIYEAVLNKTLDKPNFRRKIQKMNLLIDCKEKQKNVAHRAASLYRFDINVYDKLKEFGFTFEF